MAMGHTVQLPWFVIHELYYPSKVMFRKNLRLGVFLLQYSILGTICKMTNYNYISIKYCVRFIGL